MQNLVHEGIKAMTFQSAQKWIIVLVAIVTLGSGTLLFASEADQRDPLEPVATFCDGRFRLGGWIDSLCFSPDGKLLASSSDRGVAFSPDITCWSRSLKEALSKQPMPSRHGI